MRTGAIADVRHRRKRRGHERSWPATAGSTVGNQIDHSGATVRAVHPTDDHQLAAALAEQAGVLLLELRARLAADDAAPAVLKAEGDRQAHELLMQELTEARPGDAILSEEGKDDKARLHAERTWIVDPLDGTREYSEVPRTDWAVHVALVTDNRPVAGAVALPGLGLVLSTADVPILAPTGTTPARMIVSRSLCTG